MENCPNLKCFYSILGVQKGSSPAEIRTAYRKLAMKCHPDKCGNANGDGEQAKLKFQNVQEAYSVLSDEHKRFFYDAGLYDADDDHDTLGELVSLMKGSCQKASCTKTSSTDDEFQLLRDRVVTDTDNLFRDFAQFSSSTKGNYGQEQPTKMEHGQSPPAGAPPKPHPNLFTAMGCSNYSPGSDFAEHSRYRHEFEQLATPCPQPHPNLFNGTCFYDSISDDTQELLDEFLGEDSFSGEHDSNSTPAENSVNPSHISERFASVSEAQTTEISSATGGASTTSDINSQGFCMGVFGNVAGKNYKGLGKCMKSRRRKTRR